MNPYPIDRKSLANRVLHSLESSIRSGFYKDFLPGERILGKELGVSRVVVRRALQVMAEQGIIDVVHGRRSRILRKPKRTQSPKLRTVATLAKTAINRISHSMSLNLLLLQQHLYEAGYFMRMHFKPAASEGLPVRVVRQLVDNNPADCWVLFSGNPQMQAYFYRHQIPTYLIGKPAPGIDLPHFYIDYAPACRHAVGHLLGLGHRNIALLLDSTPTPGHDSIQQAFNHAFESRLGHASRHQTITFSPGYRRADQSLAEVFKKSPGDPTALIVEMPSDAFAALSFFSECDLKVPNDVSLLCLGYHPVFTTWKGGIACYSLDEYQCYRESTKRILNLARDGRLLEKAYHAIPEFVAGKTVDVARSS